MRRSLVGVALALALAACGDFPESLLQGDASPRDQQTGDRVIVLDVGASDLATCGTAAEGTVCDSRCKDPTTVLERTCTQSGTCGTAEQERSCEPYKCEAATGRCRTDCANDGDCFSSAFACAAGECLLAAGERCTTPADCASGFCADGVCCDTACDQLCEACNVAGSVGICTLVEAGQDPNDDCDDLGLKACKTDGFCDGLGACRVHAAGTECGASQCVADEKVQVMKCDGIGACVTILNDCFPYQCDDAVHECFKDCTTSNDDTHCASNMECDSSGHCKAVCTDYSDCQGYWNCNPVTQRCYTLCISDNECRPGKDYYCQNGDCKHKN